MCFSVILSAGCSGVTCLEVVEALHQQFLSFSLSLFWAQFFLSVTVTLGDNLLGHRRSSQYCCFCLSICFFLSPSFFSFFIFSPLLHISQAADGVFSANQQHLSVNVEHIDSTKMTLAAQNLAAAVLVALWCCFGNERRKQFAAVSVTERIKRLKRKNERERERLLLSCKGASDNKQCNRSAGMEVECSRCSDSSCSNSSGNWEGSNYQRCQQLWRQRQLCGKHLIRLIAHNTLTTVGYCPLARKRKESKYVWEAIACARGRLNHLSANTRGKIFCLPRWCLMMHRMKKELLEQLAVEMQFRACKDKNNKF